MTNHEIDSVKLALAARVSIIKYYKLATYSYGLPFAFLLLSFIHPFFIGLFLLALLPLGIVGIVFTKRGLALAIKNGDTEKKDVGHANLILGFVILGIGLLALAFAYATIN